MGRFEHLLSSILVAVLEHAWQLPEVCKLFVQLLKLTASAYGAHMLTALVISFLIAAVKWKWAAKRPAGSEKPVVKSQAQRS